MPFLEDIIHKMEVGRVPRVMRIGLSVLVVLLLFVGYNLCAFRNLSTEESMDAAQLARNISRGKGYTTLYIRPLSMFLLKRHNREYPGSTLTSQVADAARIRGDHPDLPNAPL